MLKDAVQAGHRAKYVLFDSWFSSPKTILRIKNELNLDTISMIRKSAKVNYEYNGKCCNITIDKYPFLSVFVLLFFCFLFSFVGSISYKGVRLARTLIFGTKINPDLQG